VPADAVVDTTYLKDIVGFYPFDLAAGSPDGQPVREEVRIGDRVLHSVVTPLREGETSVGAMVILRDLGDTADIARRRAEFAQVMSHELRTPLTSIAGALDIVLSGYAGQLSDRQLRYVDMARQAATRMNQLVDQLLDLARAQAGPIAVATAPGQLDRLAREVIDRYRQAAANKQLTIVMSTSAEDISIVGDPERLSQVLGNLLTNAIRFAPANGIIDVEVFGPPLSEDAVGVSVHNSGEPIMPEDRERIFEPFSASSRRVGGTALGLSISRTIIEAHGGRIWVESDTQGTKFVFTLPVSQRQEELTQPIVIEHGDQPARRRGLGDNAVALVVDDDPRRALLLKGLLMSLTERVLVCHDVDSALATARAEHPALAVVAGAMHDALALLAIFEHDPDTHKTAVMVVGEAERRTDLLAAGADDLLEFPIQPAHFREACLRLVESGRREAPRVLIVDDDPSIRQICREVLELGGYQVRDAGSANQALAEARRFRPDMIVLDVLMPGIDGYKTAEMIRADAGIGMPPIMFLSARGDTADKVRAFRSGAEDYMVKPFDAAELLARVAKALDRQARELGASPTTQLPGADAIQAEIERRIGDASAVACYLDLDNLKAFNDYYGYAKANAVIRQTGDVIRYCVQRFGNSNDFIGHIAGDDFVFVTSADKADVVCRTLCERFDSLIKLYYDVGDRQRGYIETKDRFGVLRRFPMMSVSVAAISLARAKTYAGLAELAAVGKRTAKAIPGSSYVRDGQTMAALTASS